MNVVLYNGKSLLRKTGETPECKSVWGQDAIFDMNSYRSVLPSPYERGCR